MGRTYGSGPFLSLRSKRYFLCQAQEGSTFLRSKRCFLYLSQEGSVFLRNKRRFLCLSAQRQRYFYKKRGIPVKKKFKKVEPYVWILPSVLLMAIFILVPIIFVFRMALSDVSKAGLIKGFAGFENFRKVTSSPVFAMVLKNTLVWTVAVVGTLSKIRKDLPRNSGSALHFQPPVHIYNKSFLPLFHYCPNC